MKEMNCRGHVSVLNPGISLPIHSETGGNGRKTTKAVFTGGESRLFSPKAFSRAVNPVFFSGSIFTGCETHSFSPTPFSPVVKPVFFSEAAFTACEIRFFDKDIHINNNNYLKHFTV
jgi:hypothetical protein